MHHGSIDKSGQTQRAYLMLKRSVMTPKDINSVAGSTCATTVTAGVRQSMRDTGKGEVMVMRWDTANKCFEYYITANANLERYKRFGWRECGRA